MAPEVIRESKYDRFSDIWSLGWVVIEMLQGCPPWSECENAYAALFKIAKTRQPPAFPENISYEARDFLQRCLNVDPKRRPNVRTLLRHPFITNEKINNPLQNEFYGVGLISDNFKNFYGQFIDSDEEERKSLTVRIKPFRTPDIDLNQELEIEFDNESTNDQIKQPKVPVKLSSYSISKNTKKMLFEGKFSQYKKWSFDNI